MKNVHSSRLSRLLFIALVYIAFSCTKEPPELTPHKNVFSAKVNGTPFIFSDLLVEKNFSGGGPTFYISGKDANNRYIILLMMNYNSAPKTAVVDTVSNQALGSYSEGLGLYYLRMGLS